MNQIQINTNYNLVQKLPKVMKMDLTLHEVQRRFSDHEKHVFMQSGQQVEQQ